MTLTLIALTGAPALAQDTEFAGTEAPAEEVAKPETTLNAELGGALATGNVAYYTVNGGANASHKWQRNKLGLVLGANLGSAVSDADGDGRLSDDERSTGFVENARRYWAEGRYDRYIGERDSLYLLAGAFIDPFAGYDLRSHEQLGYSRILVDSDSTSLVGEIGFDWAQENYVASVDPNYQDIYAARLMLGLTHQFNENISFSEQVELYENVIDLNDLRVLNSASLTSKLSNTLSVKLSHQLIYDNVPVEGFEPLDQLTMLTLVASLL